MKTYAALTISALIVASTMNSATAMPDYCQKLPNPKKCVKEWGHLQTGTGNNGVGKAYGATQGEWSKMCSTMMEDTKMTVGAALGDPCCKWKGGPNEATQFEVDFKKGIFTASVCPDTAAGGAAGGDAATTAPDSTTGTNDKGAVPGATTDQNSYGDSAAEKQKDIDSISTSTGKDTPSTPPASTPPATPSTGGTPGCAAKGARKLRS